MQQNPVPTLLKVLLAVVLVLVLLACELDPPMFSFSYDANGAQSGDLPAPASMNKGGSTITVAGNTGNLIKPNFTFSNWNTKQDGSGTTYVPGNTFTLPRQDVVLYAQWSPYPSYKTEYYRQNADNDNYTLHETENLSGAANTAANPVHKIYTGFTEYTSYPNTVATGTILADGSLVLKLYYIRDTYTVSFESNGGSAVSDSTGVRHGATLNSPTDPTKSGYVFSGWYKEAALSTQWLFASDTVTEDTKLYAKWAVSNTTAYTVEHYTQDLDLSTYSKAELESLSGPTDTIATATYKTYTGFTKDESNGNTLKSGTIAGNGSLTLKLYYTRNTYTVSFQTNSTVTISDLTGQPYGATIAKPNDPARQGYTFSGWYKETTLSTPWDFTNDTVQADTTLYAKWTPNTTTPYTVNYYLQDTNGTTYTLQETVTKSGTTATTGTSEAKTYTGFTENTTKSERLISSAILADGSLVLKRFYDRNTYTLTFNANGGAGTQVTQDLKYQTSTQLTANSYTRTGYSFAGWNTQANGSGTSYTDKANFSIGSMNVPLYAQWSAKSYTVYFDEQSGSTPNPTSKTVTYGSTYGTLATTSRDGYTFAGWYTQASEGDKIESTTTVSTASSHGLYAQWTANNSTAYSVEYYLQDTNGTTYTLQETVAKTGTTATIGTSEAKSYTGFTENTTTSERLPEGTILADGSLVLKRYYDRNTYALTFDANGGAGNTVTQDLKYQTSTALTTNAYTRTGYTFSGWATTSSGSVTYADGANYSIGAGTVTLYAKWTANTYTVTFDEQSGSTPIPTTKTVTYGSTYGTLATTSRDGYTFAGWYTQASGGDKIESTTTVTTASNHSLYAQWTANNSTAYSVEYYLQDTNGTTYTLQETIAKTGTTATIGTSEAKTYTGFTENTTKSERLISSAILADGSLVLKRFYDRNTYTLTFAANGGAGTQVTQDLKYQTSTALTANSYTRTGFSFAGWNTQTNGSGTSYVDKASYSIGAANSNLYAQWTADSYLITYNLNGGTNAGSNPAAYTIETADITLASPTKTHYTFAGWYASSGFTGSPVTSIPKGSTGAKTFYAKWTLNSYSVIFNANGGIGSMTSQAIPYNTQAMLSANSFSRTGYTFASWNIQPNGTGTSYANQASFTMGGTNTNLYAQWEPKSYTVTFDKQGGTTPSPTSKTVTYGNAYGTLATTSRDGYTFAGWYTQASGGTEIKDTTVVSTAENHNLYAQWTADNTTAYKTEHHRQNLSDTLYALFETENLSGVTDTTATAVYKTYTGFTKDESNANTVKSGTITGNGSLVLKLYYTRNTYTVSFQTNSTGTINDLTGQPYGATIAKPNDPAKQGYTFSGWYKETTLSTPWDFTNDTLQADTTLYAKWTPNTTTPYSVEYYLQDTNGTTYTLQETVAKTGTTATTGTSEAKTYTGFTENTTTSERLPEGTILADGSLVLKRFYDRNTYTLTFNANGGAGTQVTQDLKYQTSTALTPNAYTRTGYTFSGWASTSSGSAAYADGVNYSIGAGTVTLYAKWTADTYTVTFDKQGGTTPAPATKTVTYGSTYGTLATTSRDGYTFSGWYTQASLGDKVESVTTVSTNADHTLYARWAANTTTAYKTQHYKQNLNDAGYTLFETENLSGVTDTIATGIYKTYTGFTKDESNPSIVASGTITGNGSLVLKLYYTRNTYTVSFVSNGGSSVSDLTGQKYGALVTTPSAPTKLGYSFFGWYKETTLSTPWTFASDTVQGDTTLYAQWTADSYSITYNLNGGTNAGTNPKDYTIETADITLASPTKTHYTFDGWYTSSTFSGSPVTTIPEGSTGAKTFYAKWTPTPYKITYNLNGGTNAGTNPASYTIETATITLAAPTKTHYDFWGWYETSDFSGSAVSTIANGSSGAKTLYAKWLPTYYLVIFNANGGSSFMDDQSIRYTYQATLNANAFTRAGYSFAGWNTQADGTGTSYADQATITMGNENLTLYAQWTANTYTVSFDAQGGAVPDPTSKDVTYDSAYGTLPTTSRTGYTFAGWYTAASGGDKVESTTTVSTSSNHTLYAQWTAKTYTVTFDAQSGTTPSPLTKFVTYNNTYGTLATTTRSGYTFEGWYSAASEGDKIESTTTVSTAADHTLYARWKANTYTVTFDAQGGSAPDPSSKQVSFGSAYGSLATSTRDGYTLAGWYHSSIGSSSLFTESSLVALAEDHTLLAHWDAITYDIAYTLNGGTNSQDNPAHYSIESETITLAAPTRDGYDFVGWYAEDTFSTVVTTIPKGSLENKTFYAKWIIATYLVSYELDSGTNDLGNPTSYTILDSTITLLNPTRSHYTFGGWYTTSDFTGSAVTTIPSGSFGDKTFYAKWIPDSYTITYMLNGGTNASSNPPSYTIETPTFSLASPTKLYHDFGGWYAASDFSESAITTIAIGSTGNKTFYAKWTLTNYYVIFNTNGGSGTMASQAIPYNTQANLTANTFTRTGYSFTGWNTQSNGLGTSYSNQALFTIGGANVNLYAQWQKNTYTLTFNSNGGTGTTVTQNLLYATSTPLTANTYTRTGYTFSGWATTSSGSVVYYDKDNYSIGAANATLYAKWTPLRISITFDEEGGTTTSPETIYRDYNDYYGELPLSEKTGYKLDGWWTGDNGTGTQIFSTTTVTSTNSQNLYAKWTPKTDTKYKVEHYQQDVSGAGYTLFETENKTDTTGTQVTATAKTYTNYTYNSAISTVSGTIAANGSLVLKLYYDRKTYTVTFQSNGGSAVSSYTGIRHGATISAPTDPTRSGYVFNLWYADSSLTQRFDFATQTITANTTLYAKWWSGVVGDIGPAGGVVFHDKGAYSDGWRYLEAASTDVVDAYHTAETTYAWGGKAFSPYSINNVLVGTSMAIGTGEANSLAMIDKLKNYPTVYSGADLCREVYRQGGYSDWFLPSILELDLMARLTDGKAGAFTLLSGVYWSSSESSSTNAYLYNSAGKSYSTMPKEYLFQLRAARAF